MSFRKGDTVSGFSKTLLLVLLLGTPLTSNQSEADDQSCGAEGGCGTRVYIFRGFSGFSGYGPGLDHLADCLRSQGFEPIVRCSAQWPLVKHEIVRRRRSGEDRGPVIIIGYSLGAATAVDLTQALREERIFVDKLLLIECYRRARIPDNVGHCFNIYESRPFDRVFIFRGMPVGSISRCTTLWEINIAHSPLFAGHASDLHHFNVPDCPRVQNLVISQLSAIPRQ